ncbi:hypothetical protein CPB83DRAFT_892417 [Crepidotus variabilis]|uniref:Ricin B lectin domain-containing protein n=1 Tax=Crepidotus variabilis TaxID=179855 RepID=A0A9P6ELH8_9AGAR|nr:hypothetical protein CPB83DRAFT_892417 [Crepidotus variabilis]
MSIANVNTNTTYIISNVKAGTVIDLSAGDNRTVTGWAKNGGPNQKWVLNWTGNAWNIKNNYTGTYLSIDGSPADGTRLVAAPAPFAWHIWRDANNTNTFRYSLSPVLLLSPEIDVLIESCSIFVPNTNENIDLYGQGISTSGNPITLWYNWTNTHQTWNFTPGQCSIVLDNFNAEG